jgi:hypothetical protein
MQTVALNHPFRESAALVDPNIASSLFHIALAGHGYFIDTAHPEFRMASMEVMRNQQDNSELAGEGSLSNLDLWARSSRSWHWGAGQTRGDEQESSPYRFLSSQGINPWVKWELSLLKDTSLGTASAGNEASVLPCDGRLFYQAGSAVYVSDDGLTWDFLATLSSPPTCPMITDGTTLYYAYSGGVRSMTSGGVQAAAFTLADPDVLGISKGRIWVGAGDELYWWVPGGALTSSEQVPWAGWEWTAITDGVRATYASGFTGDKCYIYRIPIKSDGTGLDAATVAWPAPDGETVYSLTSYLGYVVIGTNRGVRFAVADDVGAFEAQDRYVWFGWSNYDDTHTGLGRIDLGQFTSSLTPAYASDLMYVGQGEVTSIATFNDRQVFAVEGVGVVAATDSVVPSGTITTSDYTYDLDDEKIATLLTIKHRPLDGTISVVLQVDGFGTGVIGESSVQGNSNPTAMHISPIRGHRFSLVSTLTPNDGDGPVITGIRLMARPNPPRGTRIVLPILLSEQFDLEGSYRPMDPLAELQYLRQIWRAGGAVNLQWGQETFNVFPANFQWIPYRQMLDKSGWTGTCVMELREVTQ